MAVLREPEASEVDIDYSKLEVSACRGSGAGGQHRNTTDSAVQIKYGDLMVRCESERSQHRNKATAMALLRTKLLVEQESKTSQEANQDRKQQVGSGMRGDKIRTIRVFDNQVKDHMTKKKMRFSDYERGQVELLY